MAAPITFQDLPDDMLHEIFERVFAAEPQHDGTYATRPAEGAHLALRCVSRRWRDIADWVRLSTTTIWVNTSELADVGAVRARHPTASKKLALADTVGVRSGRHTNDVVQAVTSLIDGSADLRRALKILRLETCCLPSLLRALNPIVSCTALVQLNLFWKGHNTERVAPSNMLAPLSALRMLTLLRYGHDLLGTAPTESAVLAPLPALPDAPRLTRLDLDMTGNFVPVGSDAALGRLRQLILRHGAPVQELVDAQDPFLLRAAFDAGTWQPSRLTGLRELFVVLEPMSDLLSLLLRPLLTVSRAGSEWAPLAAQVTQLGVEVHSDGYSRPPTGIVAGLGVLTALRWLRIEVLTSPSLPDWLEPVSIARVRAPHLTYLEFTGVSSPVNAAGFPKLVYLELTSLSHQPPLNLRSLVARSSLKDLSLSGRDTSTTSLINLAELFVGGGGWPVLEKLALEHLVLEWDATGLDGTPTAAEFAERARQLLPALVNVTIDEPRGRNALPDRSRVGFVVACRRHVVPALLGLHGGGG